MSLRPYKIANEASHRYTGKKGDGPFSLIRLDFFVAFDDRAEAPLPRIDMSPVAERMKKHALFPTKGARGAKIIPMPGSPEVGLVNGHYVQHVFSLAIKKMGDTKAPAMRKWVKPDLLARFGRHLEEVEVAADRHRQAKEANRRVEVLFSQAINEGRRAIGYREKLAALNAELIDASIRALQEGIRNENDRALTLKQQDIIAAIGEYRPTNTGRGELPPDVFTEEDFR